MTVACEVCGKSTDDQHRFCPWCGEALDDIKELVGSQSDGQRPRNLYHYTTPEAAANILATGKLWATDINQLNDASEFRHGVAVATAVVGQRAESEAGDRRAILTRAASELSRAVPRFFVASFSGDGDSRTQWGLYGRVALGFDHEKLRRLTHQGLGFRENGPVNAPARVPFMITPCVYRERTQWKLNSQLLDRVFNVLEQRLKQNPSWPNAVAFHADGFVKTSSSFAAVLKNPAFSDEREWRMVGTGETLSVRSRTRSGSPVSYVEIELGRDTSDFPIVELVIGPQEGQISEADRWRAWLDSQSLQGVSVTLSKVPLR